MERLDTAYIYDASHDETHGPGVYFMVPIDWQEF